MNTLVKNIRLPIDPFSVSPATFNRVALELFRFQYDHIPVYQAYCKTLRVDRHQVGRIEDIPFLPIQFFKSHSIIEEGAIPELIFESSGTTQNSSSKHLVKHQLIYEESFNKAFRLFYGEPSDWCLLALLPSYLERQHSSLVLMAKHLVNQTVHPLSGFYLDNLGSLKDTLQLLETAQQKTLLIGVSFALLDFAELYPMRLAHTTIMETGGMKGRREELTREQLHAKLQSGLGIVKVHSEYGMTELLSQAYSNGDGLFCCPPWMQILIREEDDPLAVAPAGRNIRTGAVNVIDLANIFSCAFIATDDAGKLFPDGKFEILGRLDHSDIRGCSLLSI